MARIQIIDNKKMIELEYFPDKFHELEYDWPMDSEFELYGSHSKFVNKKALNKELAMKVYVHIEGVLICIDIKDKTFEKCEKEAWKKYQEYLRCNHEFVREDANGKHHEDGKGYCIHCGMEHPFIFKPIRRCFKCGLAEDEVEVVQLVNRKYVCKNCSSEIFWENRFGLNYLTKEMIHSILIDKDYRITSVNHKEDYKNRKEIIQYNILKDGVHGKIRFIIGSLTENIYAVESIEYENLPEEIFKDYLKTECRYIQTLAGYVRVLGKIDRIEKLKSKDLYDNKYASLIDEELKSLKELKFSSSDYHMKKEK